MGKLITCIFFILFIFNCSDTDNNIIINKPPSNFEVSVLSNLYNNIEINWSESFDPENQTVHYSVYLENIQLANGLTERNYSFQNLEPSVEYSGKIIATDDNGNETIANFTFITNANLPPSNFEITSIIQSNISLSLNWTESIDPEQSEVFYDLYVDNTLIISNLEQEYFVIENLIVNTNYTISIIAKDTDNNETILSFNSQTLNGIYTGDLSLNSQTALNNFGALGYIEITGNLQMSGIGNTNNISDLTPLSSIKKVGGYLDLNFLSNLTTLSGLVVEYIGESYRIRRNDNLTDLNGLTSLIEVLGALEILQNESLTSISGINNLSIIGAFIRIQGNMGITNIDGFNNLNSIQTVFINNNMLLNNINAFASISELLGDLSITDNPYLSTISGFNNVNTVGRLYIEDSQLTHLNFLSSVAIIENELSIFNNNLLENILSLNNLTEITYGNLNFLSNESVSSLEGFNNLNHIGGTINIINNTSLSNLCALVNVMQTFVPSSVPFIIDNAYNPTIQNIANGNCSL